MSEQFQKQRRNNGADEDMTKMETISLCYEFIKMLQVHHYSRVILLLSSSFICFSSVYCLLKKKKKNQEERKKETKSTITVPFCRAHWFRLSYQRAFFLLQAFSSAPLLPRPPPPSQPSPNPRLFHAPRPNLRSGHPVSVFRPAGLKKCTVLFATAYYFSSHLQCLSCCL